MQFWEGHPLSDLLLLSMLLWAVSILRRGIPGWQNAPLPDAIVAGVVGFFIGPAMLQVIPFDQANLEAFVYHGLAIVFIAVALKAPEVGASASGARTMMVAIPMMAVIQGLIGLGLALALAMHPGFGLLLPLGFSQGPGQALAIGRTWQDLGLDNGGQIGLIFAAVGYAWCALAGVPLVLLARRRGWLAPRAAGRGSDSDLGSAISAPGALDALTVQLSVIGGVYLATYGILVVLVSVIPDPKTQALIWGFHFIIGSGVAMVTRRALVASSQPVLNDGLLSRIASMVIDVSTVAAFCAIQGAVLREWFVLVLAFATIGGTATLLTAMWIGRRGFPEAPFEHALTLFGMATGTLPTGLALLRVVDPDLAGPVARNTVIAATGSIFLGIPLLLFVMPMAVSGAPGAAATALGICAVYLLILVFIGRSWATLRFTSPLWSLWPEPEKKRN